MLEAVDGPLRTANYFFWGASPVPEPVPPPDGGGLVGVGVVVSVDLGSPLELPVDDEAVKEVSLLLVDIALLLGLVIVTAISSALQGRRGKATPMRRLL